MDNFYSTGSKYFFSIVSIEEKENKKGEIISIIVVEDICKNKIHINGFKWQNKSLWRFDNLLCEVVNVYSNGVPFLKNIDYRHPIFEVNNEYEFEILEIKTKVTSIGTFDVFLLKGIDNCTHEVNLLPGQKLLKNIPDKIQCKVVSITTRIRLSQSSLIDPFYVKIESIVSDERLVHKYFYVLLNNNGIYDKDVSQLKDQYDSKEGFWVFTYANKILSNFFRKSIEVYDFKSAIEINNLILLFEEWIINMGIIDSFPNEEIKVNTRLKAQHALDSAKLNNQVLIYISNNLFSLFKSNEYFEKSNFTINKLYAIIDFCNLELVDTIDLHKRILELFLFEESINDLSSIQWKKIIYKISTRKKIFLAEREKDSFTLSTGSYKTKELTLPELKYLEWSYFEVIIAFKIQYIEHFNITVGHMLKFYTTAVHDISTKELVLFNAYDYLDNYQSLYFKNPFVFNDKIDLIFESLGQPSFINVNKGVWQEIEDIYNENKTFIVQIKQKSNSGYEVMYDGVKGFLPIHHISNKILKFDLFDESSIFIEASIIEISKAFQFYIIEQKFNSKFVDESGLELSGITGEVYDGYVKCVYDYGIFVFTIVGEGLLYRDELFDFPWDFTKISSYFKKGQKLRVKLLGFNSKNQMSFSFKLLKEIEFTYYNNYVRDLFTSTTSDLFYTENTSYKSNYFDKLITEKAFCIEQYAVIQFDLGLKVSNLKIAKQFYSNVLNARSYLLNIYISYFEILQKIIKVLNNNTLDDIIGIRVNAVETKNRIQQKTIETFPDAEILIFFLDILALFNDYEEDSLVLLFNYVKKYSVLNEHKDLRTIAKITLANNLLISESNQDIEFVIKNLRFIYNYISKGILSLEETLEDRNARELREEIFYWKQRILEDESETLEFKSSLFTPVIEELNIVSSSD